MKYPIYIFFIILNTSLISSCTSDKKSTEVIMIKESNILKKSITVKGMTCVGCEVTLEEKVSKIKGVVSVKASHNQSKAFIEFDSTKTDIKAIKRAIKKAGYSAY